MCQQQRHVEHVLQGRGADDPRLGEQGTARRVAAGGDRDETACARPPAGRCARSSRGLPKLSRYSKTTAVCGSSFPPLQQVVRRTRLWRPRSRRSRRSRRPGPVRQVQDGQADSGPDCARPGDRPRWPGCTGAKVACIADPARVDSTPIDVGPTMRMPCERTNRVMSCPAARRAAASPGKSAVMTSTAPTLAARPSRERSPAYCPCSCGTATWLSSITHRKSLGEEVPAGCTASPAGARPSRCRL